MGDLSPLVDLLIVLLAAKVAAEVAERAGLSAVVGEILVGVAIGPSALGLVEHDHFLVLLGEIGVILLLFEVGLEMDLRELRAVGRSALSVAVVGVVLPFVLGLGVGLALGWDGMEAVFVGAALTATSVGISARVFGDLRALATVEARTVLGAAVADDVLGLIILTVVVRLASSGGVEAIDVAQVVVVAFAFLVVALAAGVRWAPPLLDAVARRSRSAGTLVGLVLAFAIGIAALAAEAKLAAIVGAFVAGVSLARSPHVERVRREVAPIGHLFVPVFFVLIGVDANVDQFLQGSVLATAAVLLVVAVIGKVVSSVAMGRAPGDRILVGIGMLPRGEVGLIFATIGLREQVFGNDIYASLLVVVLLTTLVTPPLLRWRLEGLARRRGTAVPASERPPSGWLDVTGDVVELAATPPPDQAPLVAFAAAALVEDRQPGSALVDWLRDLPDDVDPSWSAEARAALLSFARRGSGRGWRLLVTTDALARTLPPLDEALRARLVDPLLLDPAATLHPARVQALRDDGAGPLADPLVLAAVALDATDGDPGAASILARAIGSRIGLGDQVTDEAAGLAADVDLLVAAARRPDGFTDRVVLPLAAHLGTAAHLALLRRLTAAQGGLEAEDEAAVDNLADLVVASLGVDEGRSSVADQARAAALALVDDPLAVDALEHAPRAWLLSQPPVLLARQAALASPSPTRLDDVRVDVVEDGDGWRVTVVARDRLGLLAHTARALSGQGVDVLEATVATWPDGTALGAFRARAFDIPTADRVREALLADLDEPLATPPADDVHLDFDGQASPWHTVCRVRALDRFGLLGLVTAAFAAADVTVHGARVATVDGVAVDEFELSDGGGAKLDADRCRAVQDALGRGVSSRRRRGRTRSLSLG